MTEMSNSLQPVYHNVLSAEMEISVKRACTRTPTKTQPQHQTLATVSSNIV